MNSSSQEKRKEAQLFCDSVPIPQKDPRLRGFFHLLLLSVLLLDLGFRIPPVRQPTRWMINKS